MKNGTIKSVINLNWFTVAPGVWGLKDLFVNVYLIHNPIDKKWLLVDAGLKRSAHKIIELADNLFWPDSRPAGIILTHGHFDHIGSVCNLARLWDVPVYAHKLEHPYLTGHSAYPPADPKAGGGLMSVVSPLFPAGPINIADHLEELPEDGTIPGFPEWRYIHTPGHAPGHISLWRKRDKVLLAGDAFVTTKQESAISVMLQTRVLNGPPKYFTCNWEAAEESVKKLAALEPDTVATGHGMPMRGKQMRSELKYLAENFQELAVPANGRYTVEPAIADENGVHYVPAKPGKKVPVAAVVAGLATAAIVGFLIFRKKKGSLA
jgi:glyoxylase-like metal-dependent hydrolase (beta-lactamase superfamily II)